MKVTICNPCPYDGTRFQWGDFHFANSFSGALEELGCTVEIRYWPEWSTNTSADLLTVLRGNRPIPEIEGDFRVRSVWLISHPADLDEQELAQFDYVFAASDSHAEKLCQAGYRAAPLYQCTDPQVFYPRIRDGSLSDNMFVFVGNKRGTERPLIRSAVEADLPLKLWGRGWDSAPFLPFRKGEVYAQEKLGQLYRASYCVLNDHWPDMTENDYINNRVFDVLGSGVPLMSDRNDAIRLMMHFSGVYQIDEQASFQDQVDDFILQYDRLQDAAYADSLTVQEGHTFLHRASVMLDKCFSGG